MQKRTTLGILAAPLAVLIVSQFLTPLLLQWGVFWTIEYPNRARPVTPATEIFGLIASLPRAYLLSAILGVPTLLVLRWAHVTSWYGYVFGALVVAVICAYAGEILFAFADGGTPVTFVNLMKMIVQLPAEEPRGTQMFLAPPAVYGPLAALIFWIIARPDRPASEIA